LFSIFNCQKKKMMMRSVANNAASTASRQACRTLATQPPLTVEYPHAAPAVNTEALPARKTQVTTLANGLRVASEETHQLSSSLSVIVDAGSRYETDANNGVSSFLAHMAFKSTEIRSHLRMVRDMEEVGGNAGAESARDYIQYSADVMRADAELGVHMLAETIQLPKYAPWDIASQKKVIELEIKDLSQDPSQVIFESVHEAAFADHSSLGRSKYCPERNLSKINADMMREFTDNHYSPERMVLSGAGIEHAELVGLAEKFFGDMPKGVPSGVEPVQEKCQYVGGERRVRMDSPLTHVALAFDGGNWHAKDLFPVCVLNMLLGGGGSFSAGGPGKGMYSRLYSNVLNQHGWVENASAFNSMFNDAGLIGVYGSSLPSHAGRFIDVIAAELVGLANKKPDAEETSRAKNQLLSAVMSSLDSRVSVCEDIGRQILTYGERKDMPAITQEIMSVTPEQIQAAAQRALSSEVTLAAYGDVSAIPSLQTISNKFK
jgi:processing peptidase subunit alpha